MEKNEILEKSRLENKSEDLYEKEVLIEGGNIGAIAAFILATIFFCIQIFLGKGMNYGLYAVAFVILSARFTVKAVKLKRKHEILVATLYWIVTLMFSIAFVYDLVTTM